MCEGRSEMADRETVDVVGVGEVDTLFGAVGVE